MKLAYGKRLVINTRQGDIIIDDRGKDVNMFMVKPSKPFVGAEYETPMGSVKHIHLAIRMWICSIEDGMPAKYGTEFKPEFYNKG